MPAGNGSKAGSGSKAAAANKGATSKGAAPADERRGSNTAPPPKRETFRPPWVKDDPDGLPPKPSNLWSKTRQNSKDSGGEPTAEESRPRRANPNSKQSQQEPQENGSPKDQHVFVKPQLKPVPPKEPQTKLQSREVKVPIKLNSVKRRESMDERPVPPTSEKFPIPRQDSLKKVFVPPAPPAPPPAPNFPRSTELKQLSNKQKEIIDNLKNRPKVRPDWTAMLKDIEGGRKLKHVQCNDRSKPVLPQAKDTEKKQFIYESEKSEKDTSHNQLLKEIQLGVSLKKVKTNDRSRPQLEGLRKFRRQMTIEEQIIKSQSMASMPPEEIPDEGDELDDIDKVRDDLQSTKQMLALEMRNKEALAKESKRLLSRIAQLESELERERSNRKTSAPAGPSEADEKLVKSLKSEADNAKKTAEDLEKKFHDAANLLDNTKSELEEVRKQKLQLEKKLLDSLQGKRFSISAVDRKDSITESIVSEEKEESNESDGDDSDDETKKEKKVQRELKQLRNKLRSHKNKEDNAKKERMALKTQIKRLQEAIKAEKKKYKALKKEVNKMAALMKDPDDEDEEGEEKEAEDVDNEEEEQASEEESESESESSEESESEKSQSEAEDAPVDKKKANISKRTKKHEGRLSALKKGNYILKTNVERLQDDLNKQKDLTIELQADLDSVLSELG